MQDQETVLLFKDESEFRSRVGFCEELFVAHDDLDRIIGKYSFDESRSLKCGLNGCHQVHWNGFVIRTKHGQETICGQNCGEREFGVAWKEILATYNRLYSEKQTTEWLTGFLATKEETLLRAFSIVKNLENLRVIVLDFLNKGKEFNQYHYNFMTAVLTGGKIRIEKKSSTHQGNSSSRAHEKRGNFEVVGQLNGVEIFAKDPNRDRLVIERKIAELKFKVIHELNETKDFKISQLTRIKMQTLESNLKSIEYILKSAEEMLDSGELFFRHENLAKLSLLTPKPEGETKKIIRYQKRLTFSIE